MLREGQTREPGHAAGYVWASGEPFYGARLCPGWYQSGAGVARDCKVPFSILRMLMQSSRKPSPRDPKPTLKPLQSQGTAWGEPRAVYNRRAAIA